MLIPLVRLSPLSGCRWTTLSSSALWSFFPAPSVGLSLSLKVVALPTTGAKRGFVLVAFLDSDEVIGSTEVLSSISGINGRWLY